MNLKHYILGMIGLCCMNGCSLMGPIDELKPEYVLDDGTLITDAASAEIAVGGIYASWRNYSGICNAMFMRSGVLKSSSVNGAASFASGSILDDNFVVSETYTQLYYVVNQANSVLAALQDGRSIRGLSEEMRRNYIKEAKFNRALAHFMLLRLYGEFWKPDSRYGVVLYEEPVRGNIPKARASVADCYALIVSDLEEASDLPVKTASGRPVMYMANGLSAKGFLAKVRLSQGEYKEAYRLVSEVLEEGKAHGIVLEKNYGDVFASFDNSELLFYPYTMNNQQKVTSNWYDWKGGAGKTLTMIAEAHPGDRRYQWAFTKPVNPVYQMNKYQMNDQIENRPGNSLYMLRLSELYFIQAEAGLRKGILTPEQVRGLLAPLMKRAGFDDGYLKQVKDADLLMEIFDQKYLELFGENFEEWFDMVRYHALDGVDWQARKYVTVWSGGGILPLPRMALSGNNLLEQNP